MSGLEVKKNSLRKIYIYGAGNCGRQLNEDISLYYGHQIRVIGFIDKNLTGVVDDIEVVNPAEADLDTDIVVSINDDSVSKEIYDALNCIGFKRIWRYRYRKFSCYGEFFREQCSPELVWTKPALKHVEMHVMDSCNLNCKGCAHFSPLFRKSIPDYEARINDLRTLAKKNIYIENFYILGGEPFLNPEIGNYAYGIRLILGDDSKIIITTNGLIIPQADDSVWKGIREAEVWIEITEYPPTKRMKTQIENRLKEAAVKYYFKELNFNNTFSMPFSLRGKSSQLEHTCISDGCINIYEGKISRCPQVMYLDKFNKEFMVEFPQSGVYSLDQVPDGDALIDLLKQKIPLCDYCVYKEIPWETCERIAKIQDFAVDE